MLASQEDLLFMYAFWWALLFFTFYGINWQDYGEYSSENYIEGSDPGLF
jgi:hypothetical protein